MLFNTPILLAALLQSIVQTVAVQTPRGAGGPVVHLDHASFEGNSTDGIESFLGIPYAQPPVGNLRFRRPQPPLPLPGITLATTFGDACPQQVTTVPIIPGVDYSTLGAGPSKANASEDCLYTNIYRPAGVTEGSKLPVVIYIPGGALAVGDGSQYDGSTVVQRSVQLGEPVIYVTFNYRLNAFGWLGGKEALAEGAANVGFHDQKFLLNWVKNGICQFGGDPSRITIWGESAGGFSVAAHVLTNPVNPPFKAAIMQSGFALPIYKTDFQNYQDTYDFLVNFTGCSSVPNTLECLRAAPYANLTDAVNNTPAIFSTNGVDLTWGMSVDGETFDRTLIQYVNEGKYAKVPILGGEDDDEGTLFTLNLLSITTDTEVKAFLKEHIYLGATDTQVDSVANKYSEDPAAGSPFDTGNLSALTPEFKRLAAIQGDHLFQAGRRLAFSKWAATQDVWSFLWKRNKNVLYLGSVHSGELPEIFGIKGDHLGTDAIVNFINHGDPNYPRGSTVTSLLSNITWPKYTLDTKKMLLFSDSATEAYKTIPDTYRAEGIEAIIELQTALGT